MHSLLAAFRRTRALTESLAAPLSAEDQSIQSMGDTSPTRWHRAHTTWFFETFVLEPFAPEYRPFDARFKALFNSYYDAVGERHPRPLRGVLSRPGNEEVHAWRAHVDAQLEALLEDPSPELARRVTLGIAHEQQHQELLLTDIKHAFSLSALRPAYLPRAPQADSSPRRTGAWRQFGEGLYEVGHASEGFCFDNEQPAHRVFLRAFSLAGKKVTNSEFAEFMADGGYSRPELWLSDGWATVQQQQWSAPLYWEAVEGTWHSFTLSGMEPLAAAQPVCHVSFYEADAYARWAGARLPTEQEWEVAARTAAVGGDFLEAGALHPLPETQDFALFGGVWQWTQSPYVGYPGYQPAQGALGEYNGKFMSNQMVLRGGSCATPADHLRRSYRNFFPPAARWQFTGIRLAHDS